MICFFVVVVLVWGCFVVVVFGGFLGIFFFLEF